MEGENVAILLVMGIMFLIAIFGYWAIPQEEIDEFNNRCSNKKK